jgi:uncharacterized membrane protein
MNSSEVLLLAFLIGVVAGLRALTAPASVAWAAHRNWLHLHGTALSFLGTLPAVIIFTVLAAAELVADQLPSTPARTKPAGLIARIITGGTSGAAIAISGGQSIVVGGVLGAAGGMVGAFAGYQARTRVVRALKIPDMAIAFAEDAVAIAAGLLFVSRL